MAHMVSKGYGLVFAGLLIFVMVLVAPVAAAVWTINPGAGAIQAGINGAASGDTIILNPGTYSENGILITGKSLTIQANATAGGDRTNTIIDGKTASPRIFRVTDGSSLTIDNLTLQNGRAASGGNGSDGNGVPGGAGENGGAILSAGPVTVNFSTITGCSAGNGGNGGSGSWGTTGGNGGNGGSGGAVFTTGTVTVTSTTITSCSAGNGGAGGIGGSASYAYEVPGGPGGAGGAAGAISGATISAVSSTFTGCSAGNGGNGGTGGSSNIGGTGGNGGPGGNGGAISATGAVTGTSNAITSCRSGTGGYGGNGGTGNTIGGVGGSGGSGGTGSALHAGSGTIHFNRIVNDTGGIPVAAVGGSIDCVNNWWGGNGRPGALVSGSVNYDPWLLAVVTSTPSAVTTIQTSSLRASLTTNSAGADTSGSGFVPDGIPVTFAATGTGSVAPPSATTSSGAAAATYTPGAAGTALITTTVDGTVMMTAVTVTSGSSGTVATTSIVIDPSTPANVYAGVDGQGIYRSTTGGLSWTAASTQPENTHVRALVIKPAAPATLFAGTYGGGVYTSTDSGTHWSACTNTALANLNVLSLVSDSTGRLYAGTDAGVFTSSDCNTWTALNSGLP
jgi:hypothetical protein